ncbi:TPA: glycosyltransferase [Pseudomonas putida]|uniref:CgeB family protein n=1 Tax=Pseudomonas putida TaxID=303 RepID=UPI0023649795|nr:glycosyltransferase [Pseudomonas putida]MDD2011438.1 DUF3880 domain-containing protein [Pseudomonas putida]HDS1778910.1 glycosyltransferase [Pseudomonas putida]
MKDLIVRRAASAFNSKDYSLAISLYEQATTSLGKNLFKANILICQARLQSPGKENTPSTGTSEKRDFTLTKYSTRRKTSVLPNHSVSATANIEITNGSRKSGIALVRFYDAQGNVIDKNEVGLPHSDLFGANYVYLQDSASTNKPIFKIQVPSKSVELDVDFRLFEPGINTSIKIKELKFEKIRNPKKSLKEQRPKTPKEFKVAIIADEFTTNSFASEFVSIPVEPNNWLELFEEHQPDIFFCESAWSGPDSTRRPWQGQIYASVKFQNENRGALLNILKHCKANGIPTVFWNKEDPTHYTDRVNDFVKTAKEFDFVFTSAAECIESYKNDYGVKNVFALPFATNPKLFNPIESGSRTENIVFAGSWYGNHKDRSETMENILDLLSNQGFNLEIYDRYYGSPADIRKWPERYEPYINPSKPHDAMPGVYKSSRFGLNFNTVTESSTMFARRVFELMSSNTLVISNFALGMEEMFGDLAVFLDKDPQRLKSLTTADINSLRERALTKVLREHTYTKRWHQVLSAIGIPHVPEDERVTIACMIENREDAMLAINWYQQSAGELNGSKLLLIISLQVDPLEVANLYQEFNRFGVSVTSVSHAANYALDGRYHPIETPHFAIVDPRNPPKLEWLDKARLHLQYINDTAIAPAPAEGLRYRFSAPRKNQPIVGVAAIFNQYLKSNSKHSEVYYV